MTYHSVLHGRYSQPGQAYFVTACTQHRLPLFTDLRMARIVCLEIKTLHDCGDVLSVAWVIMPDHLHWLIQLRETRALPTVMRYLKARSAQQINVALSRSGPVWQQGYYEHAIRQDEDLRQTAEYIISNPQRAGLAVEKEQYPFWDAIWLWNDADIPDL